MLLYVVESKPVAPPRLSAQVGSRPVTIKPGQKRCSCKPAWLDRAALLCRCDQLGAPHLCQSFGALEAVPAALALAGVRIALIDNDRPVVSALSDMTSHFLPLLLSKLRKMFQRTLPPGDHISGSHPGGGIEPSKDKITSLTACVAGSSWFRGDFEGTTTEGGDEVTFALL